MPAYFLKHHQKFKNDCLDNEFWIELSPKTSINSQKNSTLAV